MSLHFEQFKRYFTLPICTAALLAASACKKNEETVKLPPDTTKPTIKMVSPEQDTTTSAGKVLPVKIKFTDDRALGACKVEVHNAFDGITHGKTAASPYAYDTTFNLSGTEQIANVHIRIPETVAAGPYHIFVNCFDKEGNEADFALVHLEITNASMPTITDLRLDGATVNDHVPLDFMQMADSLTQQLTAQLADPDGLDSVKFILLEADHAGKRAHNEPPIWKIAQAIPGSPTIYPLNKTLVFYASPLENDGHYELMINVRDKIGNYISKEIEFHVMK